MKTPRIANAVGYIDEELINNAVKTQKTAKKSAWIKWSSFAACFAVLLIMIVAVVPTFFGDGNVILPIGNEDTTVNGEITVPATNNELGFTEAYFYYVDESEFSSYVSGKVIEENRIGDKLTDVSVSAGWKNNEYEWLSNETLRAEVYLINGVSKDVAVALKFIDKGDALTTTHYYVIMNPNADLTAVKDYVIASIIPNHPENESSVEITKNEFAGEEVVVEYTSQANNE